MEVNIRQEDYSLKGIGEDKTKYCRLRVCKIIHEQKQNRHPGPQDGNLSGYTLFHELYQWEVKLQGKHGSNRGLITVKGRSEHNPDTHTIMSLCLPQSLVHSRC